MTQKELSYVEDAIGHECNIIKIIEQGIKNLESVAKRRVCIGAWDTPTHNYDRELARAIGYERPGYGCYVYILNELIDRDLVPDLRFIKSKFRCSCFTDREEAVQAFAKSMKYGEPDGLTEEQYDRLISYCDEHLIRCDSCCPLSPQQ